MFRSRITLEEYLKSVQHEDAAGEDVSLDNIDMIPNFEEEVEHVGENISKSRVSINMNPSLINIPDDFKDDKEVFIIDEHGNGREFGGRINVNMAYKLVPSERIMVPLNDLLQPIKKAGSLFNRFLADVAKRPSLCPLNYNDWRLVPQYFRGRIIMFIRGKFLLPDGVQVNQKILKSVGERVRGFKYSLRCKYVKEDTTKEALYNLEKSKRPAAVGDQMWIGLVDYFFSEKFQKWSTNGKSARGKQLHAHTSGSQSFAIKRDNFEKEHQREPGPLEWFMETHQDKEGSYHEPATKKFVDIAVDIVKRKTGASEVVFSEATVSAETFAYHKLMGPESSGRVRGVGSGVTSNQLIGKRNCQSGTEPSDSGIVSLLLKEVQSLRQEVTYLKSQRNDDVHVLSQGDDVEENQRNNTPLAGEPIRDTLIPVPTSAKNNEAYIKAAGQIKNTTVLRDKGGAAHTSRWSHVPNQASHQRQCAGGKENIQPNPLEGVNKSCTTQIGKKHTIVTNRMENSTSGMLRPHNLVNQPGELFSSMGENTNTSTDCSNQPNIARRLNFDQREQDNFTHRNHSSSKEMNRLPRSLTNSKSTRVEFGACDDGVTSNDEISGDGCRRLLGTAYNQQAQNLITAQKRKEVDTSNFQSSINLPKKQANKTSLHSQCGRAEIEKLVDKVIEENPDTVRSFRNPKRREFAHCFLGGMAYIEGKKKVDKDLLSKILYEKLFATLQQPGCIARANISQ